MSATLDHEPASPVVQERAIRFSSLMIGICAAPLFWLGQLLLGYGVTALACYPADHPLAPRSPAPLLTTLIVFDAVALIACFTGGMTAWWCWRRARKGAERDPGNVLHTGEGRTRFLALWGIMSSLWFFCAILFGSIASVTVPLCAN